MARIPCWFSLTIHHICWKSIEVLIVLQNIESWIFFCANAWLFGLGVVSREMFDDLQNAEIISTLTKKFNEVRSKNHIWKLFVLLYRNDWCLNWVPGFSLFFIVNTLWDLFVQSCYFHLFSRILWAIHCPVQVPSSSALSLACVNLPSFWWTHVGIVSFTMSTSSLLCLRCSLACLTPRSGPSDTPAPCSVSTFMCSLNKVLPLLNFTVNKMPNLVFEKFGSVKRKFPLHVFFPVSNEINDWSGKSVSGSNHSAPDYSEKIWHRVRQKGSWQSFWQTGGVEGLYQWGNTSFQLHTSIAALSFSHTLASTQGLGNHCTWQSEIW